MARPPRLEPGPPAQKLDDQQPTYGMRITRSFASPSQAAKENADSRVFAGIHFRSACRDGVQQGRKVGKFAFMHYLDMPK